MKAAKKEMETVYDFMEYKQRCWRELADELELSYQQRVSFKQKIGEYFDRAKMPKDEDCSLKNMNCVAIFEEQIARPGIEALKSWPTGATCPFCELCGPICVTCPYGMTHGCDVQEGPYTALRYYMEHLYTRLWQLQDLGELGHVPTR